MSMHTLIENGTSKFSRKKQPIDRRGSREDTRGESRNRPTVYPRRQTQSGEEEVGRTPKSLAYIA